MENETLTLDQIFTEVKTAFVEQARRREEERVAPELFLRARRAKRRYKRDTCGRLSR